jgi:3-deoxy-manno-octulosonate cytidylyltransferase (CMP-KDO synthetase)
MTNTLIVIPARMAASRLPGKPMVDIAGEPMIVHVWRRAVSAQAGMVVVATDAHEVVDVIRAAGGEALLTRVDHASGSDRVFEAVSRVDPRGAADLVVNLQGDLPTLEPRLIRACLEPLATEGPDIATLAALIVERGRTNPNVVKVVGTPLAGRAALYFTRATAPPGRPLYHHIGISHPPAGLRGSSA